MIKVLFFDYRELETLHGFSRQLEQPVKYPGNPLFIADEPWENGNLQLFGSIVKREGGPFQLWYNVIHRPWTAYMAFAESDDGLVWRKPLLDLFEFNSQRTNIVLTDNAIGPAVIYDAAEPREDWRYKLLCGPKPSDCIAAYHSADGIHWRPVRRYPVIPTSPDCPIGFLRAQDGRYVAYHRWHGFGRRVFRSESWNFLHWTGEPRLVLEPDAGDPPQIQFYGLGAATYGPYEIGTLWIYRTDADDLGPSKMRGYQEAELVYARSGHAWHRAAQGIPFIPHGSGDGWDRGNLQCASQPVFLADEIRYYFAGTDMRHQTQWELEPQTAGLGYASLLPDRFVGLYAGSAPGEFTTVAFELPSVAMFVNARIATGGWVRVELLDAHGQPLKGFTEADCQPLSGDSVRHPVRWRGLGQSAAPVGQPVRVRLRASHARVYALFATEPGETPVYHRFTAARP